MAAIQIPEDLESRIEQAATLAGETPDAFLREAILARLEDLEDIAIATERLQHPEKTIPAAQVWKNLGIED